jgi:hypothetical protein
MLETDIQRDVMNTLRQDYGALVFRLNSGTFSKGGRTISGLPKGFPDLMVFLGDGKTIFIEMKKPKGKQSKYQVIMQAIFGMYGVPYHVATSVEDIKQIILQYERKINNSSVPKT